VLRPSGDNRSHAARAEPYRRGMYDAALLPPADTEEQYEAV
jgi:hypothetical protein